MRILTLAIVLAFSAQDAVSRQSGPKNGNLVVVGGAMQDPAIAARFMELAGGADAPIVVIPTAGGADSYDAFWPGMRWMRRAGMTNVTLLHTYDRETADTEEFAAPIRQAQGVWFSGGRQWRLVDAYMDTAVERALHELLDRGGVIGGSSAGATIQGSYLARGDTRTNTVMMGDHEEGFGFIDGVAIDQHLLRRNRHFDLIEVIRAKPELLGIGIDEDTAIVVSGDRFEVMGQGYVAIYDINRSIDSGGEFYFLAPGDQYDLEDRMPYRPSRTRRPLDRVVEEGWNR